MEGKDLPLVGRELGYRRHRTTTGYVHLDDEHLIEAAEKVGRIVAAAMEFEVRLRWRRPFIVTQTGGSWGGVHKHH